MNWLPSLRALAIFGILMALFVAVYWACGGHAKTNTSSGTIPLPTPLEAQFSMLEQSNTAMG
jgi:hypothetical protein